MLATLRNLPYLDFEHINARGVLKEVTLSKLVFLTLIQNANLLLVLEQLENWLIGIHDNSGVYLLLPRIAGLRNHECRKNCKMTYYLPPRGGR